jgi:hypothetical protein
MKISNKTFGKQPFNLEKKDKGYFKKLYISMPLKVFELNDVLITNGICLINTNIVKESIHGYRDQITISYLIAQLNLLTNKTIQLNAVNQYLLIQGPIFSYYHWLTESIPRILMIKSIVKDLTLILPKNLNNIEFVKESLKPFLISNIVYISKNLNVKVRYLIMPQVKPYFDFFYPEIVNNVRELYTNYSKKHISHKNKRVNMLFISDKIENKLEIQNINEVRLILNKHKIFYGSILNYPFFEQIQILYNTKIIISTTGSDLVCINFMRKGSSVLELIKAQTYEFDQPDLRYFNLATSLQLNYYYQFCEVDTFSYYRKCKLVIDLELFEKNIILMMKNQQDKKASIE